LASGKTVKEAAAAAGVSQRTAHRRNSEPEFREKVNELRSAMLSTAAGRLLDSITDAVKVLKDQLASKDEGIQQRAAVKLIELSLKVSDRSDLEQRVAELEALSKSRRRK